MSQNPTQMPVRSTPPQIKATFKCPYCDAEKPPIMAMNTMMPLDYFIGGKQSKISTLRTLVVCGACNCILNVQFLPVDIESVPMPGQQVPEDDGTGIIV